MPAQGAIAKAATCKIRNCSMPGQLHPRGARMRDLMNGRSGFDRVLMAVASSFTTASAAQAQTATRNSAAELAIDAAVPRPEPANVPPPTASDFKLDTTASTPDAAKTPAPSTTANAPDPKPAEIVTAPESKPAEASRNETPKSDTATTTPTTPAAATATAPAPEPAREPVKAPRNVTAADQPVADKLREMLGGRSLRVFDRKAERTAVEKFYSAL